MRKSRSLSRVLVPDLTCLSRQFGNMLVLSATYCSKIAWLCELITEDKLRGLLSRTIRFLARLRYTSKTARTDIEILQAIQRKLFGYNDEAGSSGQPSFASE